MHMADALLSPAVGLSMSAVSAGAIAYATRKLRQDDLRDTAGHIRAEASARPLSAALSADSKLPLMAVTGAFVFAAQMINFTIPGTGSSGHIGGGILLAALLGGPAALLTLSTVLIIQSLFFADGGLLALGSNILNMGVVPCLLVYPLLFRPLVRKEITGKRLGAASVISVVVGLQLGAFLVVLQTLASGITLLPFGTFLVLMQPIHLAIGAVEGIVTGAILVFVYNMRPELLAVNQNSLVAGPITRQGRLSTRQVLLVLALVTVVVGGALSLFASSHPDGLEWSIEKVAGTAELEAESAIHEDAAILQEKTAFLPDYEYAAAGEEGSATGTSLSGIVGALLTFVLAGGVGWLITSLKRRKRITASA